MRIIKNRLEGIPFIPTPNFGGEIKPISIIIHYSAEIKTKNVINWFKDKTSGVSAHLILDRDGSLTQMVDFNIKAWHAGASEYKSLKHFNNFSIGIELINAGQLFKNGNDYHGWRGEVYPPEEVFIKTYGDECSIVSYWHKYTPKQLQTLTLLVKELMQTYSIKASMILGHEEIAPDRKSDPGAALDMNSFRQNLI